MAIPGQVRFHRQLFTNPVKLPWCTTESLGPVIGINKDVSGARLLPTTVSTYPEDWVCFCHVLKTRYCCLCPNRRHNPATATHLPPPTTTSPSQPPTPYNVPSVILQLLWKVAHNPALTSSVSSVYLFKSSTFVYALVIACIVYCKQCMLLLLASYILLVYYTPVVMVYV